MKKTLLITFIALFTSVCLQAQDSRPSQAGVLALKLYPNPATSYITFDLQKGYEKGLTITVFSFLGKKMIETPNITEKTTLQLNEFNRGVYIYHVTDQSGKVIDTGKFQVSR
ncbi:MAG: T9SS type A sorting domain-containing protein [Chitinophagaceae bacterium]